MVKSGKVVVRMGRDMALYDADTGSVYTGITELFVFMPVSMYWLEDVQNEE